MSSKLGISCPHCDTWATVRTSEAVSATMRIAYFQCKNIACGHTWKAHIEVVATISPSAIPRPGINLPLSPLSETLRIAVAAISDPRQASLL
ncbi:ogr/Delta-like zinc finger family protein [Orrella dioscoreae]|uniref:Zinc finger Ogr/Delta-type domain-containing protein n=1 Tax=Orrella dioscoreae TaxID=1851544 RepID=A0A1C3K394_9BURK|nr:ogr/Delta-like zinc finger family protein [Orrella dioscoreae]SBT25960.1 hypothetical protein ODI_01768 [Orrella dioscoreae]SOE50894.1 hypothetical protein ODI_R3043 [Orrella dioscoreae]